MNQNFNSMVHMYLSNYDKIIKIRQDNTNKTNLSFQNDIKKMVELNKKILVFILKESLGSRLKDSNKESYGNLTI